MALCSICKKRHAIVFTSRYENGARIDEGFCLKCAYESGISGVTDMFKATGINAETQPGMLRSECKNHQEDDPLRLIA